MVLRILFIALTWLFFGPAEARAAHTSENRYENTVRLRHAIRATGVQPGPEVERKLAAMSDHEIERLLEEHESIGYTGNPLTVIAGAIALLVLVVLLLVAIVE